MVFVVGNDPERPLGREDRRAYQLELKHFLAGAYPDKPGHNADKDVGETAIPRPRLASMTEGRPVLQIQEGDSLVQIGMAADNLLNGNASPQLVRQLLEARLQSELKSQFVARPLRNRSRSRLGTAAEDSGGSTTNSPYRKRPRKSPVTLREWTQVK